MGFNSGFKELNSYGCCIILEQRSWIHLIPFIVNWVVQENGREEVKKKGTKIR